MVEKGLDTIGKMKIFVIGTGGVGGYFGGLLAKAGKDVTFVARGEQYQAIKEHGLTVKSVMGDFTITPTQVVEHIADIVDPDLILFTVKTYDTALTAEALAKVVGDKTIIITFQNGADNDYRIQTYIPKVQVYPGVAYVISARGEPGMIVQTGGLRKLIFGDRNNPENPRLKEVESLMQDAGIDAVASDNIVRDIWEKYMFIVAFSGMTTVCRSPIGAVLSDPVTRSLYERCVREAIAVAKALGVTVAEDAFESIMHISGNTAHESKSSLLVDVEHNRNNEIETLNGALVRFAREHGVDVPINDLIYGAIKLVGVVNLT